MRRIPGAAAAIGAVLILCTSVQASVRAPGAAVATRSADIPSEQLLERRLNRAARMTVRSRARVHRLRLKAVKRRPPAPVAPVPAPVVGLTAPRRSIPLGSSVVLKHLRDDAAYEAALSREFVQLTPENELKMNRVQPEQGRFEFAEVDALVDYASTRGKTVRGHTLIFGKETPAWVGRILLAGDVEAALRAHVRAVMSRYKGRIREWDVVNEALETNGTFRHNAWFDKLGERYVEIAFAEARATDPGARLFYNEFNAETNNFKRASELNLVRKLRAKGLLDGVGLQLHTAINGYPTRSELEETMRLFADAGLEVQVTEMDVIAKGDAAPGSLTARLDLQASVFKGAADACQAVAACTRFTVWGVTDRYSWMGAEEIPLLLDGSYTAKPALAAVRAALSA